MRVSERRRLGAMLVFRSEHSIGGTCTADESGMRTYDGFASHDGSDGGFE